MRFRGFLATVVFSACQFAVSLLLSAPLVAQWQQNWRAQWISHPDAGRSDEVVLHFRKSLNFAQLPRHFLVDVTADQQFFFYVNRKLVGFGPARGDLAHWKFETYDLAPYLQVGPNLLAATVWNFGADTAIAQMSERTAFLLHGHGNSEGLADTNGNWQVEPGKGIRCIEAPLGGYVAEPGERLDGRLFDWSWNIASQGPAWVSAVPLGRGALRGEIVLSSHRGDAEAPTNWQLEADSLPPMEMTLKPIGHAVRTSGIEGPGTFPDGPLVVPANSTASILVDHSQLTTGFPELTVSGGTGATVRLIYSEALADDKGQKGDRNEIAGKHIEGLYDEFLPDGAERRTFMPLAFRAWRYLQLDVKTEDEPLRLEQLRTWFSAFPFEERAKFKSDDPELAKIWEIGWRTARLDAHDTYMDTPYWERLQYVGDTRIQALISYVVAGDDRLARQAIQAFDNSRTPDGLTQSRYPSAQIQMIPTFSLLWVGMIHDFWMYRSDTDFVRSEIPGTRTALGWFLREQRADGLLPKIPWWPFVDWGRDFDWGVPPQDQDGGSAVIALQFIEALHNGAEMEDALGDPHMAAIYRQAAARASRAILKLCWNTQYGLIADTPSQKHFSQHANILAVWLNVVPRAQQKSVLKKILSVSDKGFAAGSVPAMTLATYYFRFYLARALQRADMGDEYLRLLDPWREMISTGLTTWAEAPEPTRSDSHAWSAHPNYDLLTIVAGIHPKSPGFKSVTIQPNLGSLKELSIAMPHPAGMIEATYERNIKGLQATITLPSGVSGQLVWKGKGVALHEGTQRKSLP